MKKSLYIVIPCLLLSITQASAVTVTVTNATQSPLSSEVVVKGLPNRGSVTVPVRTPPNQTITAQWPNYQYTGFSVYFVKDRRESSCTDANGKVPWSGQGFVPRKDQTLKFTLKPRVIQSPKGTMTMDACIFENFSDFVR